MNRTILIQVFSEIYYLKVVGIYYPDGDEAPEVVIISSMYEPKEYKTSENVTLNVRPIPNELLEKMVRDVCYMFQNNLGVYKTISKAHAQTMIAKQTHSMEKVKEYEIELKSVTGSMTLRDLRAYIDRYTEEEQKQIKIAITLKHPYDVYQTEYKDYVFKDKKDEFEISENNEIQLQYLTLTKLDSNIYPIDSLSSSIPIDKTTFKKSLDPNLIEANGDDVKALKENLDSINEYKEDEINYVKENVLNDETDLFNPDELPPKDDENLMLDNEENKI